MGWVAIFKLRPLYPRERPGTDCVGGWVCLRASLERCGKSRPTGIRSPDRPAHRELLYRLRYSGFKKLSNWHLSVSDNRTQIQHSLYASRHWIWNCARCIHLFTCLLRHTYLTFLFNFNGQFGTGIFFLILAHPVFKMWIIQEPNKLALWNKRHFVERKTEIVQHV
jgi:hypothetical protein